ncbi:MAG: HAMP domain-containing sensor histidine kinase [Butyribacter sp.]|nr:HAMP domain-containing sensor histidine kinase [bacterium]MDY3854072.1 HAMP domain-containing sensor histidine kinase [Butyribacter sp.]
MKWKFIISYILITLLMLVLLNTYGQRTIYNKLIEHEQTKLYEEAEVIVKEYIPDMNILYTSDSTLKKHFTSLQTLTNMRVWLVSTSSRIIMDSNVSDSMQDQYINEYDSSFLSNQSVVGKAPKGLIDEKMITVIYPITKSLDTVGYVVLMSPADQLDNNATNYIDIVIICLIILLAIGAVLFLFLYYQTIHPLRQLTDAARKYADGQTTDTMKDLPGGDYAELASAIRYLGERMNHLTDYQKNFIANVSHDFRSPLTSIKGYTEALADGTIPAEIQEKYFNIILFEVERLTKLTSNLLELNQLDNNSIVLEQDDFDINLAIRNSSAPFEQRCLEKMISFELIFDQKELFVHGDCSKIQLVLQNLLDNAIKFSHNNSTIEIHTSERNHKVFVSVKDHGIGIPKESIPKVWSRFYKTDLSRGKDKNGTGLGLSIVKEIIEAHGENINVISTEGVGTEFIFSLPKSQTE